MLSELFLKPMSGLQGSLMNGDRHLPSHRREWWARSQKGVWGLWSPEPRTGSPRAMVEAVS